MFLHAPSCPPGARHCQLQTRYPRFLKSFKPTVRPYRSIHNRRRFCKSVMTGPPPSQLWSSAIGIRFAPGTVERPSLYPQLDMARFFQTENHDGSNNGDHNTAPARVPGSPVSEEPPSDQTEDQSFVINLPLREDASIPPMDPSVLEKSKQPAASDKKAVQPPSTSLDYQMSPEKFEKARKSTPGSQASFWSYNMYTKDEPETGTTRNVKVHYCKTKHTMEEVCKRYFLGCDVIGFDMEWKAGARAGSGPRNHVSLIQVASEAHVGLFHVAVFPKDDFVAPTFRQIMEDSGVSKAGVNIKGDCTRLKTYLGVETRGVFELSHLYKVVKYSREKNPSQVDKRLVSLATQAREVLRLPIYKGDSVRTSNWTLALNAQQIAYSASDAYACLQLYHVLEEERLSLEPSPPRPYHAELNKPLEVAFAVDDEDVANDDAPESVDDSVDESSVDESPVVTVVKSSKQRTPKAGPATPKTPKSAPSRPSSKSKPSTPVATWVDQRVAAAELQMQSYRAAKRAKGAEVRAPPSMLRAYYVWYTNADLKPDDIAKLLRDPPLLTHTVMGYILDAIANEHLSYDKQRMTSEILSVLAPNALTVARYQSIVRECRYTVTPPAPPPPST